MPALSEAEHRWAQQTAAFRVFGTLAFLHKVTSRDEGAIRHGTREGYDDPAKWQAHVESRLAVHLEEAGQMCAGLDTERLRGLVVRWPDVSGGVSALVSAKDGQKSSPPRIWPHEPKLELWARQVHRRDMEEHDQSRARYLTAQEEATAGLESLGLSAMEVAFLEDGYREQFRRHVADRSSMSGL